MRWTLVIAVLGMLVGCDRLTEDNAPEKMAITVCKKQRTCDRDAFEDQWLGELDECIDETEEFFEFLVDVGGAFGGDLDLEELARCRVDIKRASCSEYEEGGFSNDCDDIFDF